MCVNYLTVREFCAVSDNGGKNLKFKERVETARYGVTFESIVPGIPPPPAEPQIERKLELWVEYANYISHEDNLLGTSCFSVPLYQFFSSVRAFFPE